MTAGAMRAFGALPQAGGVFFRVWAPGHEQAEVVLGTAAARESGVDSADAHLLAPEGGSGFFSGSVQGAGAGDRYRFRLDGGEIFPDPASRSQPDGVHGASEVIDPAAFEWSDDAWHGVPLAELVIYELHVGTATAAGTFDALIPRLGELADLGVTAIQLMPVADFPGDRNWGYDGVYLYAPARAYGGPEQLKRLVNAAHRAGLAVLLDVVYNHFGPEGNYLPAITSGRIFTERHHTPWGAAVNYDGPGSDAVREFVIQNALYWVHEFHMDGLRLDATHAILDDSPVHLVEELAARVHDSVAADRHVLIIAEDERNERQLILPRGQGGAGLDAVWADDFHHQLRRLVAGDSEGYYADYSGTVAGLVLTLRRGWFYEGQLVERTGEARGTPASGLPPRRFVHCIQNHDQVGNRAFGERLNHDIETAAFRAASALLLLTPYTPLLWMGQEWAATSPFLYFTDHPPELGRLVTEGRRKEFGHFSAFSDPAARARIPDPQAEETFNRSKLRWDERDGETHRGILRLYRELLALRREHPALRTAERGCFEVAPLGENALALRRSAAGTGDLLIIASFEGPTRLDLGSLQETRPPASAAWRLLLSTEEKAFGAADNGAVRLSGTDELEINGPATAVLESGTKTL